MTTSTTHTWTFARVPRPGNDLVHRHWRVKHAERQTWGKEVVALPRGPWFKSAFPRRPTIRQIAPRRVNLTITAYRWNLQDPGNRETSVKPLVDALVARGWLVDDSAKWLELEVREEIDRKSQRTTVEWRMIDGE